MRPGCLDSRRGGGPGPNLTSPHVRPPWKPSSICTRSSRPNSRRIALRAGAVDVAVRTEELTSAWLGWPVRTFEHAVPREKLGFRWANFAYTSWRRLSAIDRLLESVIPPGLFYNAEVTGFRPDG